MEIATKRPPVPAGGLLYCEIMELPHIILFFHYTLLSYRPQAPLASAMGSVNKLATNGGVDCGMKANYRVQNST